LTSNSTLLDCTSSTYLSPRRKAFVRSISFAKEAWDALADLFIGYASIQESKFDEANNEADNFAMLDGEDPQELHRRLSLSR
jgi:hypothetical protein